MRAAIYLLPVQPAGNIHATGQNENKPAKEAAEERAVTDAVEYVSSTMVAEAPKIAITFDDGPSVHCTGRLLDGLKERNVKATFFLIGKNAQGKSRTCETAV